MEETLTCKCGCQVFQVKAEAAMCLKCGETIKYISNKGYMIKEYPAMVVTLNVYAMNYPEEGA